LRIKQAHELAGIIALANHDYQTALHELEQANMRNPNVLVYLAAAHDGLGERKKALELEHRLAVFYADNKLDYALIRGRDQTRLTATGAD